MGAPSRILRTARRRFYNAGGPWYRCRLFEALGSRRYSRPALFDMDEKLARLIPQEGTFLEAGAHDGYTQSNTYFLERFGGWSGILVEPIPELRSRCAKRRPRSRVVVGDGGHAAEGLSVAGRAPYEVTVPAKTLTAVLDEAPPPAIDLMVLDLEGHELEALAGLDFDRYAPANLLLEALEPARQKAQFDQVLEPRYELLEELSPYDLLYRRRD